MPVVKIVSRWDSSKVLHEGEYEDLRTAVGYAVSQKVNLRGANLYGANLYGADLCGANLRGADLCGADLCGANLRGANLRGANLYGANLRGADLRGADLCGADLCGADLCGADLCGANLYGADLYGANLYWADLCGADLRGADLRGADLRGANLYGANGFWQSRAVIAELLRREAGSDYARLSLAGVVLLQTGWCWPDFLALPVSEDVRAWALDVLADAANPEDMTIPQVIKDHMAKRAGGGA